MSILSKLRDHGRQYPLVAIQDFTHAQVTSGEAIAAIKLPAGARVIGGGVLVSEVFNSSGGEGAGDTLIIGDGGDPDRYTPAPIALGALGFSALTVTGYGYPQSDYLDLTWTGVGTTPASTGKGKLIVTYVVDGRANELNPDYD